MRRDEENVEEYLQYRTAFVEKALKNMQQTKMVQYYHDDVPVMRYVDTPLTYYTTLDGVGFNYYTMYQDAEYRIKDFPALLEDARELSTSFHKTILFEKIQKILDYGIQEHHGLVRQYTIENAMVDLEDGEGKQYTTLCTIDPATAYKALKDTYHTIHTREEKLGKFFGFKLHHPLFGAASSMYMMDTYHDSITSEQYQTVAHMIYEKANFDVAAINALVYTPDSSHPEVQQYILQYATSILDEELQRAAQHIADEDAPREWLDALVDYPQLAARLYQEARYVRDQYGEDHIVLSVDDNGIVGYIIQ